MIKFTYTKDNGDVSERVAIVLAKPSQNYLVLDISSVPPSELAYISEQLEAYELAKKNMLKSFGLDKYVKSFKPAGMSNVSNCG